MQSLGKSRHRQHRTDEICHSPLQCKARMSSGNERETKDWPGAEVIPQSITTTWSFSHDFCTNFGFPKQATTVSAPLIWRESLSSIIIATSVSDDLVDVLCLRMTDRHRDMVMLQQSNRTSVYQRFDFARTPQFVHRPTPHLRNESVPDTRAVCREENVARDCHAPTVQLSVDVFIRWDGIGDVIAIAIRRRIRLHTSVGYWACLFSNSKVRSYPFYLAMKETKMMNKNKRHPINNQRYPYVSLFFCLR